MLRGLDERGRLDVQSSGRLWELAAGDALFEPGDPSDALFVVVRGEVELWSVARGDEAPSLLRVVTQDGTFGEEAVVAGLRRSARAVCSAPARVAEVPLGVLSRSLARAGATSSFDREVRALERASTRSLLATLSFGRYLDQADLELLLDAVHTRSYAAGQFLQRQGDAPEHCLLLQKGLVQIQSEQAGRVRVHGYLSGGDFFGDEEILAGEPLRYSVVAMGDTLCMHADAQVMRRLCDGNVGLAKRLRRLTLGRRAESSAELSAATHQTQHVLKDAYRMQMARSLLAIDQESCVRCGHCAWACAESHSGVSRLIRSGDKIVVAEAGAFANLLLPNTCQHCEHPACMIDCPTGAIGRDAEGEVFIREQLCTGCGACAKACPWHNIQLAPRASLAHARTPSANVSALVAVKCDLCRDYAAPACVRSCPTDAIQRLDPRQEFSEVRALFNRVPLNAPVNAPVATSASKRTRAPLALSALCVLVTLGFVWQGAPRGAFALGAGVLAGVGSLGLASHALLKRRVSLWLGPREKRGLHRADARIAAGSALSPWVRAHQSLGLCTLAATLWHSGFVWPAGASGALLATILASAFSGSFGALMYRWVPPRLSRLEWRGALPEELGRERRELVDRLYRLTSGQDALLKRVTELILGPYSRSPWQSLCLLASGRDLKQERARLRRSIDERLEGRGQARLLVLDDLIKVVVDLRALPLRRGLTAALRVWQPIHAGLTLALVVLLALHVIGRLG